MLASASLQFRAFLVQIGLSKTDIVEITSGCGSVWVRAAFATIDAAQYALDTLHNAKLTLRGSVQKPTGFGFHKELVQRTTKVTTTKSTTTTEAPETATTTEATTTAEAETTAAETGSSDTECLNKHADCEQWFELGFCDTSRALMQQVCQQSCKFCSKAKATFTVVAADLLHVEDTRSGGDEKYEIEGDGASVQNDGAVRASGESPGFKWTLKQHPTPALSLAARDGGGWTVGFEATQAKGTGGYVFAKTNADGDVRYLALYSGNNGLTVYYRIAGSSSNVVRSFKSAGAINDGARHQVVLWGEGSEVGVRIDSAARSTRSLSVTPTLVDCGAAAASCVFALGQRADGAGGARDYSFSGLLHSVTFVSNKAIRAHPAINVISPTAETFTHIRGSQGSTGIDWLDASNHNGGAPVHGGTGAYGFSGSTALKVLATVPVTAAKLTAAVRVQLAEGTGGYIFAKTSRSGKTRYFALYVSKANKDVVLYYTPVGQKRQSIRFEVDLTTGGDYRILLSVDAAAGTASLFIDNVRVGPPQQLNLGDNGSLRDCGKAASNCVFLVGRRSSSSSSGGSFGMTGFVREAFSVSGVALTAYPA